MVPIENDTVAKLADRIIKLAARIAALQEVLTPEQKAAYQELAAQNERLFPELPDERAWRSSLRRYPNAD